MLPRLNGIDHVHVYVDNWRDAEEWYRFALWMRGIFMGNENLFQQYDVGVLDASVWQHRCRWLKALVMSSPAYKEWWDRESAAGALDPRFVQAVDSIELDISGEYLFDLPEGSA